MGEIHASQGIKKITLILHAKSSEQAKINNFYGKQMLKRKQSPETKIYGGENTGKEGLFVCMCVCMIFMRNIIYMHI